MTEHIIIGTGGDIPVARKIIWPSNSYKQRDIKEENILPSPVKIQDSRNYFNVKIKFLIWPEIYDNHPPIQFPTLDSALRFAKNNCTVNKPLIRVFMPSGQLIETFEYKEQK